MCGNGFECSVLRRFIVYRFVQLEHLAEAAQHHFQEWVICIRGIRQQTCAIVWIAELSDTRLKWQVCDFPVGGMRTERIEGEFQPKQHAYRTRRDLGPHGKPVLHGGFNGPQQFAPAFRRDIGLCKRNR